MQEGVFRCHIPQEVGVLFMWMTGSYSNAHTDLEKAFYRFTSHPWALSFSLIRYEKILYVQIGPY